MRGDRGEGNSGLSNCRKVKCTCYCCTRNCEANRSGGPAKIVGRSLDSDRRRKTRSSGACATTSEPRRVEILKPDRVRILLSPKTEIRQGQTSLVPHLWLSWPAVRRKTSLIRRARSRRRWVQRGRHPGWLRPSSLRPCENSFPDS